MPFQVEDTDKVYILPVACIVRPLIVVRDFGSKVSFLHVLAKKYWRAIFKKWIEHFMKKSEQKDRRGKRNKASV